MAKSKGRHKAKLVMGILAVFVVCWITQAADADVQKKLINFQGYLTDNAVPPNPLDGTYNLTFRIYNQPGDQTPAWTEAHTNVPVIRGNVSVLLGSIAEMKLAFDELRYLGIQVGTDPEMTPRQQLLPSFHASAAETLVVSHANQQRSEFGVNNLVPIGGIISYFGDPANLPGNWRVCDGSAVNDPESSLNGATLPDMRGKFARGEENASRDIFGGALGSGGSDSVNTNHTHVIGSEAAHVHNGSSTSSAGSHNHANYTELVNLYGSEGGVVTGDPRVNLPAGMFGYSISAAGSGDFIGFWGSDHRHGIPTDGSHSHTVSTGAAGTHSHGGATAAAGSVNQDNRPAFLALHYIIRIK